MAAWKINEQFRGSDLCRPVTVAVSRELFQDYRDVPVPGAFGRIYPEPRGKHVISRSHVCLSNAVNVYICPPNFGRFRMIFLVLPGSCYTARLATRVNQSRAHTTQGID
jgi:hypothetical protein